MMQKIAAPAFGGLAMTSVAQNLFCGIVAVSQS